MMTKETHEELVDVHTKDVRATCLAMKSLLSKTRKASPPPAAGLRRCLSESWFADTLAWLLDPKASHGLGVKFLREMLARIALRRKESKEIETRSNVLRANYTKVGVKPSEFKLLNTTTIREFFLSGAPGRNGRRRRFADLVLLDLDPADRLFVVFEIKLFTTNHSGQLSNYYDAVQSKFDEKKKLRAREQVYLTVHGDAPRRHGPSDDRDHEQWIRLSWLNDVLPALAKFEKQTKSEAVEEFIRLLRWMEALFKTTDEFRRIATELRNHMLNASQLILLDELNRLGEGAPGSWSLSSKSPIRLRFSSTPKRPVRLNLLPNGSTMIRGSRHGKTVYDKILIPFGIHPDQVYNLFQVTARDIYEKHFDDPSLYRGTKRARTQRSKWEKVYANLFELCYRNRFQLPIIFTSLPECWEAKDDDTET